MEINIETQAPLFIRYLDDGSIEIGTEKISDINSRGDLVDIMIKIKKDNPETIITVKPFDPQSAELTVLVRKKGRKTNQPRKGAEKYSAPLKSYKKILK